jgi:alanine racemase
MVELKKGINFESLNPLHEEVILMGKDSAGNQIKAFDVAKKLGTIPYEVLTSCGVRVPRRYIDWR